MASVTAQEVWNQINKDAEFRQQPAQVREAMRPYIEALPTVLANLLDKPATLSNTMQAKVDFLRYCVNNGYIKVVVTATPEEALGWYDREELVEMFDGMIGQLIDMAEELTGDAALLKGLGVTEDQVMLGPNVGLNAKAQALYKSKKLTIGKLLQIQPMLIVKNTK